MDIALLLVVNRKFNIIIDKTLCNYMTQLLYLTEYRITMEFLHNFFRPWRNF